MISFDDIMHALEYATRDTLFGVLFGRDGVSESRSAKMREIFSEYYILLAEEESKLSHLRDKVFPRPGSAPKTEMLLEAPTVQAEEKEVSATPVSTSMTTNGSNHKVIIATLANLINAVRPLADLLLKDNFSGEEREELRRLTGGDGVFKVGNLLGRLSSETARVYGKK